LRYPIPRTEAGLLFVCLLKIINNKLSMQGCKSNGTKVVVNRKEVMETFCSGTS
jgi:hypothetical protein